MLKMKQPCLATRTDVMGESKLNQYVPSLQETKSHMLKESLEYKGSVIIQFKMMTLNNLFI